MKNLLSTKTISVFVLALLMTALTSKLQALSNSMNDASCVAAVGINVDHNGGCNYDLSGYTVLNYYGCSPFKYFTVDGQYIQTGTSANIDLTGGTHTICFHAYEGGETKQACETVNTPLNCSNCFLSENASFSYQSEGNCSYSFTVDPLGLVSGDCLPLQYSWDFGDGTTTTGYNVFHTFQTATNPYTSYKFTVCLTVTASNGQPLSGCRTLKFKGCYPSFSENGNTSSLSISDKPVDAIDTKAGITTVHPNPFTSSTTITFDVPQEAEVQLEVRSITGQVVQNLINNATFTKGIHQHDFDATGLSSGIYFYTLRINGNVQTGKMVLK